ncbi:diguanylate cyclase [Modestobacter sp. L9-4]|uniref:GGDEF domain-containing protein n=1 Tax=Modestobacter sp. L9-4 TaxID=2851567 RepID=UPI001F2A0085|nr:GGDEF domain-containing protein [Modestobacter sp. L9-4]
MTRHRGATTRDRRLDAGSRHGGRSVAERALGQIRLVAVALLLVGGAGHHPAPGATLDRGQALVLVAVAAVVLLLVSVVSSRAGRARTGRRSTLALVATAADALVVLGVVGTAGLPPRSMALVLLMLPLLEAALWFGLVGLAVLWTLCSAALGVLVVTDPTSIPDGALGVLVVAMPTLLLATIPVAMLAEHLVAQVGRLGTARAAADDRARLLGDLSAITADIFPLDVESVLSQLVRGAQQLGAVEVTVAAPVGDAASTDGPGSAPPGGSTVLRRELAVPGGTPYAFRALVTGSADEVARRVEALDLLVAQARVGLANAVLVRQLERLKQTYEEQATRDQLTGLLNRRGLVLRAEQLPGRLGVLFCDLDGFKAVNDTLGHAAGDELLTEVAHRLERCVGPTGVLGRMGGDEFVVVVPGASEVDLTDLGLRIEGELARSFVLPAGTAVIGVSIGAASTAVGEQDLEALLTQADRLMYEVKRSRATRRSGRAELTGAPA